MSADSASLESEQRGAAAWLWLNRPEARNALDAGLIAALERAFRDIERTDGVRTVVLAGRGPAFCAGGDLGRMAQAARMKRAAAEREAQRFARLLLRIHSYPKPVIARVQGPAYAGGMGLAAACDFIVAGEEAEFALPETRIGLVPAMISPYIVRALGERRARRYILTGERLSAQEALQVGMAHSCVPTPELDAAVDRLCQRLAAAGPEALSRAKRLVDRVAGAALGAKLARETAAVLAAVRSGEEAREGIQSFLEKRKPRWAQG